MTPDRPERGRRRTGREAPSPKPATSDPERRWRVALPPGVRPPYEVYVNGVRQELGVDFSVRGGELVFDRELVARRQSRWAWFIGLWGIGTYPRNDEVDVRYELDGQPMVANALRITPPT